MLMAFATIMWRGEVGAAQLTVSWGAPASGNQSGFYVERADGNTGAFAQIASTTADVLSYVNTSLAGGGAYCYRVRAYNAAGTSAYSNTACGTAPTDTQPPTVSLTAPAQGATVSGSAVTVSASASDNSGVAGVRFQLDGVNLNAEDTISPYSMNWNTTTAANGTHSLTAIARDTAGNTTTSPAVTITISNIAPPPPPTGGLVAAYGFNEGSGSTVNDASGNGNSGVIAGAAWVTAGKSGAALSFNGTNSWVTINDTALLHLTTGMTLEAWIYPTALSGQNRTVILKQYTTTDSSFELYATEEVPYPITYVHTTDYYSAQGPTLPPLNTWTHLASTYDGSMLRMYLNGVQVGSTTVTGNMKTGSGPLRIGGNSLWGEYFQGLIDEVRVYNRALTASEIQTDMTTPVAR
jgi:hypothetical protein